MNSREPNTAEAHITVFLVQRHTSSIIFAWRAFTRTLWKSDWDIKNAWKISPHFIPYITLIYKFINNPNSNLPSAKGVNIRFEDALQTKRAFPTKCHYFYYFYLSKNENSWKNPSNLQGQEGLMHQHLRIVSNAIKPNVIFAKNFLVSSSTFSKAQTCSKLFSGHRLSFYLAISEKCNLQYAAWFYHYPIPKLRMQTLQSLMHNWMFAVLNFAFQLIWPSLTCFIDFQQLGPCVETVLQMI